MKLKNGYRWRYDQNKQNFCFRKVAHLEFTLYGDFWLSHHGDCATFQKTTFSCHKCDYVWNQQQCPFSLFQNKIDKGSHNWWKLLITIYVLKFDWRTSHLCECIKVKGYTLIDIFLVISVTYIKATYLPTHIIFMVKIAN